MEYSSVVKCSYCLFPFCLRSRAKHEKIFDQPRVSKKALLRELIRNKNLRKEFQWNWFMSNRLKNWRITRNVILTKNGSCIKSKSTGKNSQLHERRFGFYSPASCILSPTFSHIVFQKLLIYIISFTSQLLDPSRQPYKVIDNHGSLTQ